MKKEDITRIRLSEETLTYLKEYYEGKGNTFATNSALVSYAIEEILDQKRREKLLEMEGIEKIFSTIMRKEMVSFAEKIDKRILKHLREQTIQISILSKIMEDQFLSHLGAKEREYLITEYRKKVITEMSINRKYMSFDDLEN